MQKSTFRKTSCRQPMCTFPGSDLQCQHDHHLLYPRNKKPVRFFTYTKQMRREGHHVLMLSQSECCAFQGESGNHCSLTVTTHLLHMRGDLSLFINLRYLYTLRLYFEFGFFCWWWFSFKPLLEEPTQENLQDKHMQQVWAAVFFPYKRCMAKPAKLETENRCHKREESFHAAEVFRIFCPQLFQWKWTEEDEHFSTPQSNPRLCGRNSDNTEAFRVPVLMPQPKMLSRRRSGHILPNLEHILLKNHSPIAM